MVILVRCDVTPLQNFRKNIQFYFFTLNVLVHKGKMYKKRDFTKFFLNISLSYYTSCITVEKKVLVRQKVLQGNEFFLYEMEIAINLSCDSVSVQPFYAAGNGKYFCSDRIDIFTYLPYEPLFYGVSGQTFYCSLISPQTHAMYFRMTALSKCIPQRKGGEQIIVACYQQNQ